jgi:hypothetical protein
MDDSEEDVKDVMNERFEGDEMRKIEEIKKKRIKRILKVELNKYFDVM